MIAESALERRNYYREIQSQIKRNEIITFPCILIEFKDNDDVKLFQIKNKPKKL